MIIGKVQERSSRPAGTASHDGPAKVTVFTTDETLLRTLSTLLGEDSYQVSGGRPPESLASFLLDRRTDAILLDIRLPTRERAEAGLQVRGIPTRPTVPIIGVCDAETPYDARLAALKDGFWDVLELPGQSGELAVKVANWIVMKRDVDGLQITSMLDAETGHYSSQGIKRRLRELAALTQRTNSALSCVVFGADRAADTESISNDARAVAGREFSLVLHHRTRNSDVIGRLEALKFLVLAPHTGPSGAARLAERFTTFSLSRLVAGDMPLTFSAGVAGVEGRNGQVQTSPELLLNAADRALNQARTAGAAQVAAAWGNV
jgi:GGDEF domain-containing protein